MISIIFSTRKKVGDKVKVTVKRDNKAQDIQTRLIRL